MADEKEKKNDVNVEVNVSNSGRNFFYYMLGTAFLMTVHDLECNGGKGVKLIHDNWKSATADPVSAPKKDTVVVMFQSETGGKPQTVLIPH